MANNWIKNMFPSKPSEADTILSKIKLRTAYKRLYIGVWIGMLTPFAHLVADVILSGFFSNYLLKCIFLTVFCFNYHYSYVIAPKSQQNSKISCLLTEVANSALIYVAMVIYPGLSILYSQVSCLVFVFYQSFLYPNFWASFFLAVKQTLMWVGFGLYYSKIASNELAVAFICTILLIVLYSVNTYYEYLKDLYLCKSKIKVQRTHRNILSIVEAISDNVLVINQQGSLIFANNSAKSLLKDKQANDYFSQTKYYRRYNDSQDGGICIMTDIKNLFKHSLDYEVLFGIIEKKKELTEWKGKLIEWNSQLSIILCGRNVSHLVKMEKESHENQYKSALLRTVSHELRTPASAVISIAQLIQSTESHSPENIERLEIIKDSCNYQLCLINDLLDYAQILSGTLKVSKVFFSIGTLLKECAKMIQIQIQEKLVTLRVVEKNLPEKIYSDPHRLKQIVLNLLSNARKFTAKGEIVIKGSYTKDELKISCKDTGIGISSERICKLFIPFNKLENTLNPQGVGLGLVISNMLVKELGGNGLKVRSQVNRGSLFGFSIPTEEFTSNMTIEVAEENANIYVPSIYTKTILMKYEILIVDDTYFNIVILGEYIKNEGLTFSYALNGQDAIEKIKGNKYSCILMDCEMPIMDGFETTRRIRDMGKNKDILTVPPIIAFTAHPCEIIRSKCLQAGMDDIIQKPCPIQTLTTTLKYWIFKSQGNY